MVSEQKLAANRRNAQKSTGPRTLSGKAIASRNAIKHGLCSSQPLITNENEAAYSAFVDRWLDELRPCGARQEGAAEQNILAAWQIRRVPGLRAGLICPEMEHNAKHGSSHPMRMDAEAYANLGKLDRHQAALERSYQRRLKELEQLQAAEEEQAQDSRLEAQEIQNEPTEPSETLPVPDRMATNREGSSRELETFTGNRPAQPDSGRT